MTDREDVSTDQPKCHCTPRPDRAELANIWFQSGLPQGLSMEWMFDRFDQTSPSIRRPV